MLGRWGGVFRFSILWGLLGDYVSRGFILGWNCFCLSFGFFWFSLGCCCRFFFSKRVGSYGVGVEGVLDGRTFRDGVERVGLRV